MIANLPLYFNCYFFDKKNQRVVRVYKIEHTDNVSFPFHLFKHVSQFDDQTVWIDLSVYATILDCVGTFLKELSSADLSDEVYHGQASINPLAIMSKIDAGASVVSIYDNTDNEAFRLEVDISFDKLIDRMKIHLGQRAK